MSRKDRVSGSAYVPDPLLSGAALTAEELRDLREAGVTRLALSGEETSHLLGRVAKALEDRSGEIDRLNRLLAEANMRAQMAAHPTRNLLASLEAMSPSEREQALAAIDRAETGRASAAMEEAARAQTVALSAANRARFVLAALLGDERLPEALRPTIKLALESFTAPAVQRPTVPVEQQRPVVVPPAAEQSLAIDAPGDDLASLFD